MLRVPCAFTPVSDASVAMVCAYQPLDGLQRWQMFMILVTLIMSQLLVNIWMFYAKGAPLYCLTRRVEVLNMRLRAP